MTDTEPRSSLRDAAVLAALHVCRSQLELEERFAAALGAELPGCGLALCLAKDGEEALEVRFAIGESCPLQPGRLLAEAAWPLPAAQRLEVRYGSHQLGELLVGAVLSTTTRRTVADALTHFATGLVNLVLNSEARQVTDDYCSTLQALEEGIVLFQEPDPEAVTARLLSLASSTVGAMAGALYVLEEVGNASSALLLKQALGMPESLLEGFRSEDGAAWPDCLLAAPVHFADPSPTGAIAGLSADCVPSVLSQIAVLPLSYHGVQAGICLLFNPRVEAAQARNSIHRLQSFGQLAAALLHRLHLERIKENSVSIQRELEIAETIQKRLVPSSAPPCPEFDFAWRSVAAKSIGGDYVDLTMSSVGDIHAIVADAAGHGINSALLMTSFRANYRGSTARLEPAGLAGALNDEVAHEVGPTGMFITAALARIERGTRRLLLSSAGHNPVMLFRAAAGKVEQVEAHGPPMGFVAGATYADYRTVMDIGDVLLLYTDGITEACNAELEMFGERRLETLLQRVADGSAQDVLDAALAEVTRFAGTDHFDDDVSLMVIKAR